MTAELNIHFDNPVPTKRFRREINRSNIHGRSAIDKTLITKKTLKSDIDRVVIVKSGLLQLEIRNMVIIFVLNLVPNIRQGLCLENAQ